MLFCDGNMNRGRDSWLKGCVMKAEWWVNRERERGMGTKGSYPTIASF